MPSASGWSHTCPAPSSLMLDCSILRTSGPPILARRTTDAVYVMLSAFVLLGHPTMFAQARSHLGGRYSKTSAAERCSVRTGGWSVTLRGASGVDGGLRVAPAWPHSTTSPHLSGMNSHAQYSIGCRSPPLLNDPC